MSSPTLLNLPKELHLRIYEYVYPCSFFPIPIPLAPLSHALPRASKQIYLECLPTYLACRQIYYSERHFTLYLDSTIPAAASEALIQQIPKQDFDKIVHLTITARSDTSASLAYAKDWIHKLVHPNGG
nr:hypothetical protein B0A51_10197 [Rachicladosporium sp. CCFEE 5018]